MAPVNRAPGIAFIESFMEDTIAVSRPARGPGAKVLNQATGRMEQVEEDASIYTGYALFSSLRNKDKEITIGEAPRDLNAYDMLIPRDATSAKVLTGDPNDIMAGDVITVTTGGVSSSMTGITMRVLQVEDATHPVYKRISARQESDAPGSPEF